MAEIEDGATPPVTPPVAGRFAALPPRIDPDDMVEEQSSDTPAPDTTPDPNREVAWRWGLGI